MGSRSFQCTFLLISCFCFSLQAQVEENAVPEENMFSIFFGGGSYYIDQGQVQELYDWLDSYPDIEHYHLSIHGHTDDIGSIEYNQYLSQMRCQAALQKLLDKGLDLEKLAIQGFGEANPIFDNATWKGKLQNRRVDIIIHPIIL